jgi:hypothetical protein
MCAAKSSDRGSNMLASASMSSMSVSVSVLDGIIMECCQCYCRDVTWKLTHAQNVQQKLRPRYHQTPT